MKKNGLILTAAILVALSLGGCGGQQEKEQPQSEAAPDTKQEAEAPAGSQETESIETKEENKDKEDGIKISFETENKEYKAEDGTVLLTSESVLPTVHIADNPAAAAAINDYLKPDTQPDGEGNPSEEIEAWAKEDYQARAGENWHPYSRGITYSAKRADNAVISFVADAFMYTGGAHANADRSAYNFNAQTGALLKLEDVVTDRTQAEEAILAFILEETKKEEYKDMLFEGYEDSIGDLLTDTTWYLADDGFHVIGNEYIISPHAAGILDFVIPYEQADFLKTEYSAAGK